ncbi:hypothetical protein CBOM_05822 [Ceraceosorus bombacis]|uniref:Uncharacterized protein n=1 Tax=Ceraceosorus bombacis TaxID=401625 RepID=A0A0N7LBE4_9BASI|nr:hypothetical protein CBOM_05822 [Ceraceosorus bombacis]
MGSFDKSAVSPLPSSAIASAGALYDYLQPVVYRTWTPEYWHQVYFFLATKIAITLFATFMMTRLIFRGEWWFVRRVRVRKGVILVPKITDSTILLGGIFIATDAAYRIKFIQWFRGPTYQRPHNALTLEAMRLFPAFLAAWNHMAASSLIWPLRPADLNPWLWHAGWLGLPIAFLASFLPPIIISDVYNNRGLDIYSDTLLPLIQAAGTTGVVTDEMQRLALQVHEQIANACFYIGIWALIGGIWIAILVIPYAMIAITLCSRLARAYRRFIIEFGSIWGLMVCLLAPILWIAVKSYPEMRDLSPDAKYGSSFMRTNELFHTVELWAVVVFDTLVVTSMLKRQAFPLKVDVHAALEARAAHQHQNRIQGMSIFGNDLAPHRGDRKQSAEATRVGASYDSPGREMTDADEAIVRHSSTSDRALGHRAVEHPENDGARPESVASSRMPMIDDTHDIPMHQPLGSRGSGTEDLSWYAGMGAGRSIVLQALASGQAGDLGTSGRSRRPKAAWRQTGLSEDVEQSSGSLRSPTKFATPHGFIGPALSPTNTVHSPRGQVPNTPIALHNMTPSTPRSPNGRFPGRSPRI